MIFNLLQYLITNFPLYSFCVDGFKVSSPDNINALNGSGGEPEKRTGQRTSRVQVLTRNFSSFEAKKQAEAIYDKIQSKFGLTLPAYSEGADSFPAVVAHEINPLNVPYLLGTDENGRYLYTTNYYIVTGGN